jgi:hypothetical protein
LTGEPAEDHRDDADGKAAGDEDRQTPAEGVSDDLWSLSEARRAQHLASVVEGLIERAECHLLIKRRTVADDEADAAVAKDDSRPSPTSDEGCRFRLFEASVRGRCPALAVVVRWCATNVEGGWM